MKSNKKPLFYMKCWLEMKIFLTEVVRDDAEGYPYVRDVLKLKLRHRPRRKGRNVR